MFGGITAVANGNAFHAGLILTALGFGFRHGIDWDHIAALTDITSSQHQPRRSMFFATLYALGHALVVLVLGVAAIMLAARVPSAIDTAMERFVGVTLIALGLYVLYGLVRRRRDFRMRSRWMLLFSGVRAGRRWARSKLRREQLIEIVHEHSHSIHEIHEHAPDHVHQPVDELEVVASGAAAGSALGSGAQHRHPHRHVGAMPDDPFLDYAPKTAFGIGMIHGVGAETPTQILIFLTAAGAGGKGAGVLLLVSFLVGLLASNTIIALAGTFGFLGATRNFGLYMVVSIVTAVFSLVIGCLFLFGGASLLPAFFGG